MVSCHVSVPFPTFSAVSVSLVHNILHGREHRTYYTVQCTLGRCQPGQRYQGELMDEIVSQGYQNNQILSTYCAIFSIVGEQKDFINKNFLAKL